jgi:hypothetical protein
LPDKELAILISETLREMQLFSRGVTGGMVIRLQLNKDPIIEKVEF